MVELENHPHISLEIERRDGATLDGRLGNREDGQAPEDSSESVEIVPRAPEGRRLEAIVDGNDDLMTSFLRDKFEIDIGIRQIGRADFDAIDEDGRGEKETAAAQEMPAIQV